MAQTVSASKIEIDDDDDEYVVDAADYDDPAISKNVSEYPEFENVCHTLFFFYRILHVYRNILPSEVGRLCDTELPFADIPRKHVSQILLPHVWFHHWKSGCEDQWQKCVPQKWKSKQPVAKGRDKYKFLHRNKQCKKQFYHYLKHFPCTATLKF